MKMLPIKLFVFTSPHSLFLLTFKKPKHFSSSTLFITTFNIYKPDISVYQAIRLFIYNVSNVSKYRIVYVYIFILVVITSN